MNNHDDFTYWTFRENLEGIFDRWKKNCQFWENANITIRRIIMKKVRVLTKVIFFRVTRYSVELPLGTQNKTRLLVYASF